MAKLVVPYNSAGVTVNVFIRDNSVTTGAGLTGLAWNSAGLTAGYILGPRVNPTALALVTTLVTGPWVSGGFVQLNAVTAPGWYRLDLPDVIFQTPARQAVNFTNVLLFGAVNMEPVSIEIQIQGGRLVPIS